jgi:hypothetical protein
VSDKREMGLGVMNVDHIKTYKNESVRTNSSIVILGFCILLRVHYQGYQENPSFTTGTVFPDNLDNASMLVNVNLMFSSLQRLLSVPNEHIYIVQI